MKAGSQGYALISPRDMEVEEVKTENGVRYLKSKRTWGQNEDKNFVSAL